MNWQRAIILIDMDAFFASIEQLDNTSWRGQPVAVTNGEQGSCVITCSYEARQYGIKTGMRLPQARSLCNHLIQAPSRPHRYVEVSNAMRKALYNITPDIEIFSIDEAFLDVTHCQKLHGSPESIATMAHSAVLEACQVTCSVGLSGDKTTAKYAAKLRKPNHVTVIKPWEAEKRLLNVPVTELCGIANGMGSFLAKYGVFTCGDMKKLPVSILTQRFGPLGRRVWLMCQGKDPSPVLTTVAEPKTVGHGKVIPPNTTDKQLILIYLQHMSEKVAKRLRKHNMLAQRFFIGLRQQNIGWLSDKIQLPYASDDGKLLFQHCKLFLAHCWLGQPVSQVQITALDPKSIAQQLDLFDAADPSREPINHAMDEINQRFGEFTVAPARLIKRSSMPNVISPAWKPVGHRETIK